MRNPARAASVKAMARIAHTVAETTLSMLGGRDAMAPYLSIRVLLLNGGVSLALPRAGDLGAVRRHFSSGAGAKRLRPCQRSSGPRFVKVLAWPAEHSHHAPSPCPAL